MIFEALSIQGFRSFNKDQVLDLTTGTFVLLTGHNEVDPDLGANGCGKSSIWDALCWVLYGKTARGQRAAVIANWDGESIPTVSVDLRIGDVLYNLTRTWDPNTLALQAGDEEARSVTQEEVDELLGVSYEAFLRVVLMSQFGTYFLDETPTKRLDLLSGVLDLDEWLDRSKRARVAHTEAQARAAELERDLSKDRGSADELSLRIRELDDARAGIEADDPAESVAERLTEAEEELGRMEFEERRADDRVGKAGDRLLLANAGVRVQEREGRDIEVRLKDARRALEEHGRAAEELLESPTCPTCYQPVDRVRAGLALDAELGAIEFEIEKLEGRLQRKSKKIQTAAGEALEVELLGAVQERKSDRARKHTRKAREEFDAATRAFEEVDRIEADILRAQVRLTTRRRRIRDRKNELGSVRKELDGFEYWRQGFKDLRLWLIEQALTELEVATNNTLPDLGLEGWSVVYSIEKPKADGSSVIRGFTVDIYSPYCEDPMPWAGWSGGETQRLRIAASVGLADLIASRLGISPSIEVWDEPTAHLSEEGIEDVLAFYKNRSRQIGRAVWLVDHRSLTSGDFDRVVNVVKTDQGSIL